LDASTASEKTIKYAASVMYEAVPVDDTTIAFISPHGNFTMRGNAMPVAVESVIKRFETPSFVDDVVLALSDKYSASTVAKLIDFLIEKKALVTEAVFDEIQKHSDSFLNKSLYLTMGRRCFEDIVNDLATVRIGIYGAELLAESLESSFSAGGLLKNIKVKLTDRPSVADDCELHAFIDACDLIVVAGNYHDHFTMGKVNEYCMKKSKKFIRVVVDGINAEIGPFFIPGETCCYACMQTRMRNNLESKENVFHDLYSSEEFGARAKENPLMLSSFYPLNPIASCIAYSETVKHLSGLRSGITNQVISVNCVSFNSETHYVFKDYRCRVCK